jgi:Transposase DDE domain group 1
LAARRKAKSLRRQRRIERRLAPVEWSAQERPMLRARAIRYDVAERAGGLAVGGIGLMQMLAQRSGLVRQIDRRLELLKVHLPYHESDHVLNIAYNVLCGGTCLEDLELRRNDEVYLDALGAQRTPDCTTAGDFCRRFAAADVEALMDAVNETRLKIWAQQPASFLAEAVIEADGTMAETGAAKKEGVDISYDGRWGYHPLLISLANTQEPLFVVNRSGNRPSHEGAAAYFDRSVTLCRRAGFKKITLRGDTDFSQTAFLDGWNAQGVRFVFGFDAKSNLTRIAGSLPGTAWQRLERLARYEVKTEPRARRADLKQAIIERRDFKQLTTEVEDVADFEYQPNACATSYRMVVLRKVIGVTKGQRLLQPEVRYFFFITNDRRASPQTIVLEANQRCNQENLIAQLKHGVPALKTPVDTLVSNWAYMVMASLAWTLKAWLALLLPEHGGRAREWLSEKRRLLTMEFKRFLNAFIRVPAQIVRSGRRVLYRLLAWNPWQSVFLRAVGVLEHPLRP